MCSKYYTHKRSKRLQTFKMEYSLSLSLCLSLTPAAFIQDDCPIDTEAGRRDRRLPRTTFPVKKMFVTCTSPFNEQPLVPPPLQIIADWVF